MQSIRAQQILSILGLIVVVGCAASQPAPEGEGRPPRSFQRMGTTRLRHGSPILCLAYAPDGHVLAAGGSNDPLRLWDPKTGALVREFQEPWVQVIAFSTSGETMVFASLQRNIRIWNFKLGKETGKLEGHKAAIKALAISPDTSVIASGSQDGAILLWDWNTKRKVEELSGHTDEVTALVYTPNNQLLISAGSDRVIQLWNADTNKSRLKLDAGCGVLALAVSADSQTLYSAGDDSLIRRWDLASGKQTGVFKGHEGSIVSLLVQGDQVVSGALDQTIRFWNAKTTQQLRSLPRRRGDDNALAITRSGDFVATAGSNNSIRIIEAASGKEVNPVPSPQAGLTTLVPSPDRKTLAAVSLAGQLVLMDAQAGKVVREWDSKHTGDIVLAYSPDGKTLVSAADVVRLWDPETGLETGQIPLKAGDPAIALALAPDGKALAIGLRSAQIDLVDLGQKKVLHSLKYAGALYALAWSGQGKALAGGGSGKITLWNPDNGEVIQSFDPREGPPAAFPLVASLTFSPDGRTLAAGGFDAAIRVYALHAKNPSAEKEQIVCEGHLSMPYAVAFSPDGRTLVSGSFDRTVRLWEAFSGKQIVQLKGHLGSVMGVAFATDGRSVYSAATDATVLQWDVPGLLNNGKLPELALEAQQLEDAWKDLASEETPRGHETMWRCIASGKQAVSYLLKTNKLYLVEPERIKKLFRDLDSGHYPTRLAAMKELTNYGRWMEGRFDAAMANPPSLEYKRRVETLKEKLNAANSPTLAQERLRMRRFMLICEQVGNPEAIEALQKLADRGPEEELQEEARGSLQRLGKR